MATVQLTTTGTSVLKFERMDHNRKFYLTPNRILDSDILGDVQYFAAGTTNATPYRDHEGTLVSAPPLKQSQLSIAFKDSERDCITLYGEEADTAWENFRRAADINDEAITIMMEKDERFQLPAE